MAMPQDWFQSGVGDMMISLLSHGFVSQSRERANEYIYHLKPRFHTFFCILPLRSSLSHRIRLIVIFYHLVLS